MKTPSNIWYLVLKRHYNLYGEIEVFGRREMEEAIVPQVHSDAQVTFLSIISKASHRNGHYTVIRYESIRMPLISISSHSYSKHERFWSTPKRHDFGVLQKRTILEYSKTALCWSTRKLHFEIGGHLENENAKMEEWFLEHVLKKLLLQKCVSFWMTTPKTNEFGVLQKRTFLEYSKTAKFWSTPKSCVFGNMCPDRNWLGALVNPAILAYSINLFTSEISQNKPKSKDSWPSDNVYPHVYPHDLHCWITICLKTIDARY